ncbi:hypothetical protein TNCV_539851 [Trichonephila clavipes]|nr:hypothetical protein TNCV_539851 [Trichonephila clavipes]
MPRSASSGFGASSSNSPRNILCDSTALERHRLYPPYTAFFRRAFHGLKLPPSQKIESLLVVPSCTFSNG